MAIFSWRSSRRKPTLPLQEAAFLATQVLVELTKPELADTLQSVRGFQIEEFIAVGEQAREFAQEFNAKGSPPADQTPESQLYALNQFKNWVGTPPPFPTNPVYLSASHSEFTRRVNGLARKVHQARQNPTDEKVKTRYAELVKARLERPDDVPIPTLFPLTSLPSSSSRGATSSRMGRRRFGFTGARRGPSEWMEGAVEYAANLLRPNRHQ